MDIFSLIRVQYVLLSYIKTRVSPKLSANIWFIKLACELLSALDFIFHLKMRSEFFSGLIIGCIMVGPISEHFE